MSRGKGDPESAAWMRVARRYLGLADTDLARYLDVKIEAVRSWERDKSIPPCGVIDEIVELVNATDRVVAEMIAAADADTPTLVTYRTVDAFHHAGFDQRLPPSWHQTAVARALAHLGEFEVGAVVYKEDNP